jgi:plasmid stabilization system protein ParE
MARIVWSGKARSDLLRLHDFLAPKSENAAAHAIQTIRHGLRTLEKTPEAGLRIHWLPEGYRQWFIPFGKSGYVVLYLYSDNEVVVQTIRHGREVGFLR